jgi:predicted porin
MNKSILALAVLGGSAAFATAQSTLPPAGVTDTSFSSRDKAAASVASAIASGSRVGSAAGAGDAPVVFTVEHGAPVEAVGAEPGQVDQAGRLLGRQGYLGLAGDFGAIAFDRQQTLDYLGRVDIVDGATGGAGNATGVAGNGLRRFDSSTQYYGAKARGISANTAYGVDGFDGSEASRAWGLSVGVEAGPLTVRAAHQNRHVARIHLYDLAGNSLEARNSIIAANFKMGWGSAYAAYSVNRGWGSSPLFNPDNPYGAGISTTPSTDSRDVLVGVAVPVGRSTTLLASFIHKNDRDLANRDANQMAIGATYTVSRRTDFYAAYSHLQNINGAAAAIGNALARGAASSAVNIGMRHAF